MKIIVSSNPSRVGVRATPSQIVCVSNYYAFSLCMHLCALACVVVILKGAHTSIPQRMIIILLVYTSAARSYSKVHKFSVLRN